MTVDNYTIEPSVEGDGYWLIANGTYDVTSVLGGERFAQKSFFHADVKVVKAHADEQGISYTVEEFAAPKIDVHIPDTAPNWFDALAAGELWDEDY